MSDNNSRSLHTVPGSGSGLRTEGSGGTQPAATARHDDAVRVLLVDDNGSFREAAGACLRASGYSVSLASSGFEALASVVQCRPDVVFANTAMPRLDGYQICALIKSNSDYRDIPVIMVTGRDGLLDQSRVNLVGSDAHVSRPFTAQALIAAVRKVSQPRKEKDGQIQTVSVNEENPG